MDDLWIIFVFSEGQECCMFRGQLTARAEADLEDGLSLGGPGGSHDTALALVTDLMSPHDHITI